MKKMICAGLTGMFFLIQAAAVPDMGGLHAKSAALYASNGQELYAYNADEPLQPASVTKVMTLLLAMEALESGEVTLDTMITGSEYACSMGGTQVWLEPGEQLSLDDMLKAIAVGSANDCAVAVAEHLAGTEAAFVERMNERAAGLGCTNTRFINANGLDGMGEKTMTSARDIALISCELLRHPRILDYTGIWMDSIRGGAFSLANTNKMLKSYPGLTGLKTGYISEAGYCISASAERDGLSLVAVVMAAPTKETRMADATALLNYGFATFCAYTPPEDQLTPVPVRLGRAGSVQPVIQGGSTSFVVEKNQAAQLETHVALPDMLTAPVQAGQQLGSLTVSGNGDTVLELPLVAAADVEAVTVPELFLAFVRGLSGTE